MKIQRNFTELSDIYIGTDCEYRSDNEKKLANRINDLNKAVRELQELMQPEAPKKIPHADT